MKRKKFWGILFLLSFTSLQIEANPENRELKVLETANPEALVSTQWLEDHMDSPQLVILDVRDPEQYAEGHVPGAVNVPAVGAFITCFLDPNCGMWMEVPEKESLFKVLGDAGISETTHVVVVSGKSSIPGLDGTYFDPTMASRVAITLLYAGIEEVSILKRGFTKWIAEERPVSSEAVVPGPASFKGTLKKDMFIAMKEVKEKLGTTTLLDTRDTDVYFGIEKDMTSSREGHIPTAKVLPAPWLWKDSENESGESAWADWKDVDVLMEMADAILGEDRDQEIIIYCGVGGYASPVYFVLSELMGYSNLRFYDGSMQEWTSDPDAPVVKYRFE